MRNQKLECKRHFVGISNEQPLRICASVSIAIVLAMQGSSTMPYIYIYKEFVKFVTMYIYNMFHIYTSESYQILKC